eukprot:NODE_11930_length_1257_cov_3.428319.p4 GENE.NODE_11930_length_1257_cov_3.428319~~NODE_11930_length_1257_cov_3.428319.p4  ORF type:complete len:83 (+),score=4.31 NODE_11930_length_1257_cov_3.428319:403-651(+)
MANEAHAHAGLEMCCALIVTLARADFAIELGKGHFSTHNCTIASSRVLKCGSGGSHNAAISSRFVVQLLRIERRSCTHRRET